MTIASSGAIAFTTIQTEFGGSNPISMSEYYAGGSYVPAGTSGTNGAVPSSGQISVSQFYGTTATITGQIAYTSPGSYSWVAPATVTSVSIVAVGGGGAGVGGGGALAYLNNYSVTPGTSYTVTVGSGGNNQNNGNPSSFNSNFPRANGGYWNSSTVATPAGTYTGGGNGGNAGRGGGGENGGAGAGGYTGAGGDGAWPHHSPSAPGPHGPTPGYIYDGFAGSGGGGGGGASGQINTGGGGGGGGVGILGQGTSGARGEGFLHGYFHNGNTGRPGGGGSGGSSGGTGFRAISYHGQYYCEGNNTVEYNYSYTTTGGSGGSYGGGAGNGANYPSQPGGGGAVRIIYPGTTRQFPSTNTGNM